MEERGAVILCLEVAVEFEELWEEGKDECERNLGVISRVLHLVQQAQQLGHTKSSKRERKITRKICFRLAGDTGVADIVGDYQ